MYYSPELPLGGDNFYFYFLLRRITVDQSVSRNNFNYRIYMPARQRFFDYDFSQSYLVHSQHDDQKEIQYNISSFELIYAGLMRKWKTKDSSKNLKLQRE